MYVLRTARAQSTMLKPLRIMVGTPLLDVMKTSELSTVASESHAANENKDCKLVPVAKNQTSLKPDAAATGNRLVVRFVNN
jgi:hypothetical protein